MVFGRDFASAVAARRRDNRHHRGYLRRTRLRRTVLYDYWILGIGAEPVQPRWSVIRNVLHWID